MQEIKIPDGCKASIDFEKRVVVIEQEIPLFKKGDIVIYCTGNFTIIGELFGNDEHKAILYASKKNDGYDVKFRTNRFISPNKPRLANPYEQQLLFDALAKEGKKWNADTLQIEDIEKDILVPESIGIFQSRVDYRVYGDTLYIAFNNSTQLLNYNSKLNTWGVSPLHSIYEKVQCKLTPCKRKDLKPGDTAFISETFRLDDSMLLDRGRYVKIIGDKAIKINKKGEPIYDNSFHNHWYKVEPINK